MQIAIDGPAGAGKSSVAREVARRLKLAYLDTGAMYRAVTLKALQNNVDITDGDALVLLARTSNMDIQVDEQEGNLIYWGGENITRAIRSPDVNKNVSVVAESPELRKELVSLQRKIAKNAVGIVMEGRDIGTNVLPGADYKFFLTAQVNERARRRWKEIKEKDIKPVKELEVLSESPDAGVYLVASKDGSQVFVTGHPEYDPLTLHQEYVRDRQANKPIQVPENYYPKDDPNRQPMVTWRAHANLLFSNWLNYHVYQETSFEEQKKKCFEGSKGLERKRRLGNSNRAS